MGEWYSLRSSRLKRKLAKSSAWDRWVTGVSFSVLLCSELDCELSEEDWKKYIGMNNLSSPVREKERGNPLYGWRQNEG